MIRSTLALFVLSAVASGGALRNPAAVYSEPFQATTGTVQGQVTDAAGAAVAGASVTLSNSITNYKVSTKTDDAGAFRFQNVPYNSYKLSVIAPEFQQSDQTIDL